MEAYVKSTIDNKIGTIEFFHPQSNSMPGEQLRKLAVEITDLGHDPAVNVIVLKSAGDRAFCAGASFDELMAIKDRRAGLHFFSGFAEVINAIRKVPKFVLVRVQGKAVGGGVGIAAAGDYAFATEFASVKLSELALGIGPFVVGPAVERKIGTAAFTQLAINATEFQSARWAEQKGLYAEVHATAEEMDAAIEKLAAQLAKSSPKAMQYLKEVAWSGTKHWGGLLLERAKISGELVLSDFTTQAINQFKTK